MRSCLNKHCIRPLQSWFKSNGISDPNGHLKHDLGFVWRTTKKGLGGRTVKTFAAPVTARFRKKRKCVKISLVLLLSSCEVGCQCRLFCCSSLLKLSQNHFGTAQFNNRGEGDVILYIYDFANNKI